MNDEPEALALNTIRELLEERPALPLFPVEHITIEFLDNRYRYQIKFV